MQLKRRARYAGRLVEEIFREIHITKTQTFILGIAIGLLVGVSSGSGEIAFPPGQEPINLIEALPTMLGVLILTVGGILAVIMLLLFAFPNKQHPDW